MNLHWPDQQIKYFYMELKLNPVIFAFTAATERVARLLRYKDTVWELAKEDLAKELVFDPY